MKFTEKLTSFIVLSAFPYILMEFIKTESCTHYLWWENVLVYCAIIPMIIVWVAFWFNKFLGKYKNE